ncbi:MAG: hypothetical protein GY950_32770 [bacterium]|nr:hypothetical protein [bacterium]
MEKSVQISGVKAANISRDDSVDKDVNVTIKNVYAQRKKKIETLKYQIRRIKTPAKKGTIKISVIRKAVKEVLEESAPLNA